mgnify:FL=1
MWIEFFLYVASIPLAIYFLHPISAKHENKLYDYLSWEFLEQEYEKTFTFIAYLFGFISLGIRIISFLWLIGVTFSSIIFPIIDGFKTGFNLY